MCRQKGPQQTQLNQHKALEAQPSFVCAGSGSAQLYLGPTQTDLSQPNYSKTPEFALILPKLTPEFFRVQFEFDSGAFGSV